MLSPYHLLVKKTQTVLSFSERIKEKMRCAELDLIRQIKRSLHEGTERSNYDPDVMKYLVHASELCCYLHPKLTGAPRKEVEELYKQVEHERWQRVYLRATRDGNNPELRKEALEHLNTLANVGFKPTLNFFKERNLERAFKIAMRKAPENEYVSFNEINHNIQELIQSPHARG